MASEVKPTKGDDGDFGCGVLLRDIEEISKALYLHKMPRKTFNSSLDHPRNVADNKTDISEPKSNVIIQDSSQKDNKKSSIWNWKPLKALAHLRNHRFNCCFFLHVHAIEGLPPNFNNLDICVTWKRRADMSKTRTSRVCLGMAEFEETLMYRCNVYGGRNGPHSSAKYEPKLFSIYPSVIEAPVLDIGKHWIDLSRLLPLTMEELEEGKSSTGKWTTSFKLTGKAKGAMLNVSFGFSILDGDSFEPGYFVEVPDILKERGQNHNLDCVTAISSKGSSYHDSPSANVKCLEGELSHSVTLLYRKLNEGKMDNMMEFDSSPDSACGETRHEFNEIEFDVIDQGIEEVFTKDQIKIEKIKSHRFENPVIETIDVAEIFEGEEETALNEYVEWKSNLDVDKQDEQESATDDPESTFEELIAESIENDFLNMLSFDHNQEDIDLQKEHKDDFDLSFAIQAVETNYVSLNPSFISNRKNAERLENLETEVLMQEWGLNEKAFQYSPRISSGGFGSPVYLPAEEPLKLPCIEEGVGPIIRTKDGGLLRSMNPLLFRNGNNGARLIVQVSAPVVLPSKMGFTVMDVLKCWASEGVEKMCVQTNELMPLEDVTGKTMQQVLSESESHYSNRWALEQGFDSEERNSDYVSTEDLIPMAITNIEGLLIEGLKIQCGIPDQEAPSSISIKLARNSDSLGKVPEPSSNFSIETASDFPVMDMDELMKYTLSLKEWLRLDSGRSLDNGIFRKNFVMCFKMQLRDPSRDYETVGPAMLALIQADKVLDGTDYKKNEDKIYEPMFKVLEVHLAGLNVVPGGNNTHIWGTSRQRQSGARWLISSGLTKSNKNLVLKSSTRKALSEDVLWSISCPIEGEAVAWDDRVALNVHIRNPDIIFSD
ncbi:hypothetical protein ABFS82_05G137400 [Erythranthe guttata]|uniref:uncharacterized protein LOC105967182 n=1 Tax=Erythranthe guttata TaxID=4155 RepID=UPI00064E0FD9|nr:PREDICTED: uncharacterized protein LOC105967182 [Erythranthe guttata]|eukprot:XP_012847224.1 PREDICTED: uncharacterized protein LOC105967182 [Erythranthe guttata]